MRKHARSFILLWLTLAHLSVLAQKEILNNSQGIRVLIVQKDFPLLKVLLPGQSDAGRGIEIEFPEHVTGINTNTNQAEHLYLVTNGARNVRTMPVWRQEGITFTYTSTLNNTIEFKATLRLEEDGLRYTYEFTNKGTITYRNLQAVTCIKLYSVFADSLLQRTYVHHREGFDLMASETPARLSMPYGNWLPCRYLVSYSWPVPANRTEKDEDGITRYYKSRKADLPLIATSSKDKKWTAASFTKETGNLWTNPERSCHHVDPSVDLGLGETKAIELRTLIVRKSPDQLLPIIKAELTK